MRPVTITLTPEQEQIVDDQLKLGIYTTPEEVVASALRRIGGVNNCLDGDQQKAVREMLEFVENNRNTLTGISVTELIHEGHNL